MLAQQIKILKILGHNLALHLDSVCTGHVQQLGHLADLVGAEAHEITQRLRHHIIQAHHNRQRQQHGQAARKRAHALFVVKLLHLLGVFIPVVGIFFLQLQQLGLNALHIHHTLFLFPVKGQHNRLGQQRKQDNGQAVAAHSLIDKAHNVPKGNRDDIKHRSSPSARLQNS